MKEGPEGHHMCSVGGITDNTNAVVVEIVYMYYNYHIVGGPHCILQI